MNYGFVWQHYLASFFFKVVIFLCFYLHQLVSKFCISWHQTLKISSGSCCFWITMNGRDCHKIGYVSIVEDGEISPQENDV
jgi:hypothetical protein